MSAHDQSQKPTSRISPEYVVLIVVLACVVVVVALTLGLSLAGARVFHGSDIVEGFAPWRSLSPDGVFPTNPLVGDTVDGVMPARAAFKDRLYEGDIALWQSTLLGGRAFGAVPDMALFSALNIAYWILPLSYAVGLVKLLELVIAIGFTAVLLRNLGLGRASALFGGLLYAFSGFQVVWTNWSQTHVGALIAALFWAIELAIRRSRWIAAVPLAIVVSIMWFEGFPSVTGYALMLGGIYAIVRTASLENWPARLMALGRAGVMVLLGTSLAMVQLLPFAHSIQALDLSTRAQSSGIHLPLRVLATLVVPNAFGSPVDRNYFGPINYIEIQSFVGISAVLLVAVALAYGRRGIVPRPVFWYFIASAAFVAWLLFVGGPLLGALQKTPLFGMNFVGRMRSVFGFLVAIVAAVGFEVIMRRIPNRAPRRQWLLLAGIVAIVAVVFGGALQRAHEMASANLEVAYFKDQVVAAAIIAAIGLLALLASHARRGGIVFGAVAVVSVLFLVEAARFAMPFWPQIQPEEFYPDSGSHAFLSENLGEERLVAAGLAMYPGTTAFYGLRSVTGHAFHPTEWRDLLLAVDPDVMHASPTFSIFRSNADIAYSPILDRLSARYLVADPRIAIAGNPIAASVSSATSDGTHFEVRLPVDGPVRGVSMVMPEGFDSGDKPDQFTLDLISTDDEVMSQGIRRIDKYLYPGALNVAVPEVDGLVGSTLRLRYEGDTPIVLETDDDGVPRMEVVLAESDGLDLVYAHGTVLYDRLDVLPRIRWGGTGVVEREPSVRVAMLAEGMPSHQVVLSGDGPSGSGGVAEIEIVEDSVDTLEIEIAADGSGYLVVADSMQRDWIALVDGEEATVRAADHAGIAVYVDSGRHVVNLTYDPAGWSVGLWVSFVAAAVLAGIAVAAAIGTILRRRRPDEIGTND